MSPAERYNTVLLFGAPGVGKGTQGKALGCIPGLRHLATGDMFRGLDHTSEIGQKIKTCMASGKLIPDDLTVQLWREHLKGLIAAKKYDPARELLILDGIPRSVAQARAISKHVRVLRIIHLACPNVDEMVRRMKLRGERENRPDDSDEKIIRGRFDVYRQETEPVLAEYDRALVSDVNAIGSPIQVLLNVLEALVPVYNRMFSNPLAG